MTVGTDTISSLEPKLWKLIPDKIKHASTLSAFKPKIKSWTVNNCPCRLCKIFVKDLGFVFVRISSGIHTNAYSAYSYTVLSLFFVFFFLFLKGKKVLK